jgi:DNA-binding response OmpR family regulator
MSTFQALIVDDERLVRQATARALGDVGFKCQLASDGRDALQLMKDTQYDLVVTDLRMPDVNGHKLVIELLSLERRPIISVLTGVDEPKIAKDLNARGVERVFHKPVDYLEFAADLLSLVERRSDAHAIAEGAFKSESSQDDPQTGTPTGSLPDLEQPSSDAQLATTRPDKQTEARNCLEEIIQPNSGGGNKIDAAKLVSTTASGVRNDQPSAGIYISNAFSTKIDAELSRTKKALLELERTVAAGQNLSYIYLALALGTGLIGGLILGWLGSQLLGPTTVLK